MKSETDDQKLKMGFHDDADLFYNVTIPFRFNTGESFSYAREHRHLGFEQADACVSLITTANGAMVVVESCWLLPGGAPVTWVSEDGLSGSLGFSLELIGTAGSARIEASTPA